ncbi:hypothetical protein D9M72_366730 [compost metagenome]
MGRKRVAGHLGGVAAGLRCAIDLQCHVLIAVLDGAGGKQHPGLFLGAGVSLLLPFARDDLRQLGNDRRNRAAFGGERQHRRVVTQRRAVIGARQADIDEAGRHVRRLGKGILRPLGVAIECQRRGDMRLGERRGEVVDQRVGVVAQVVDRRLAIAGEHVERIGDLVAAVLGIGVVADAVLQVFKRLDHRGLRHVVLLFAGAGEEIGDIGVEPEIAITRAPEAETARRRLIGKYAIDRLLHPFRHAFVVGETGLLGELAEVEQRQRAARRLLGAAIGVAIERHQQRRHIEGGRTRDAEVDRGALQNAVGEQLPVDRQAASGRDCDDLPLGHRQGCRTHKQIERLFQ